MTDRLPAIARRLSTGVVAIVTIVVGTVRPATDRVAAGEATPTAAPCHVIRAMRAAP